MMASLRRLGWAAVLILLTGLALVTGGEPAFAAAPCVGSACDGKSPFDSAVKSGCGTFVAYGGAGSSDSETVTILYSKTCRAAYAEFDIASNIGDQHSQMLFYQPQYSGPAKAVAPFTVSSTVAATTLISWDYTMKGCVRFGLVFAQFTDPEPNGPDNSTPDYCTLWY